MIKSLKHIALPVTIHYLTGSTQVFKLLNGFRHRVSIPQLQKIETAMAEKVLSEQQSANVPLPRVIHPGHFITFCWDNIALCEEPLSGKGTTQGTNGIVVQRQDLSPRLAMDSDQTMHCGRTHQRTVHAIPSTPMSFNVGKRCQLQLYIVDTSIIGNSLRAHQCFLQKDFVWIIARLGFSDAGLFFQNNAEQTVPSWSGFNSRICLKFLQSVLFVIFQ